MLVAQNLSKNLMNSRQVFHSLDEFVDGGRFLAACAIWYRQPASNLSHFVRFQVEKRLDQVPIDETLK